MFVGRSVVNHVSIEYYYVPETDITDLFTIKYQTVSACSI
jgi:hypothetical protein